MMQRPMTIAFAGDSIANQWAQRNGLSPLWWAVTELWPCEYTSVLNSAVGGTSSAHLISTQIAQLEALATPPDVVIVQSLQNDYIGNVTNADTYFANYQQYAERALATGVSLVCLCAHPPKSSSPDVASAVNYLNRKIETYCRNTPGTYFVDVMAAWRRTNAADTSGVAWRGTAGASDAFSNDGTHPLMSACRAAAPLIVPVLQKYARPVNQLTGVAADYDNTNAPWNNVLGQDGLMLGTNGQLNGVNNSGVAGSAASTYKRWYLTDGNGVTATPSIVTGPDGYLYQRVDFSGTASANATVRMRRQYVEDVASGTFIGEATVICSGLTGVADIGYSAQAVVAHSAGGSGTETISITGTLRFRGAPIVHSNSGFANKNNDVYVTFKNGTTVSGYMLVGRVGIHRVA